ncbi:hypothetical protein PCIT_a3247 [Pseudoalteromonas citrea]|uniref:Uncharacterized protein n=2 Tax=Pseudoalteromonas citrea TaxID=43655 RepID=A0AAD4FR23_9GAMM|nr:hypothetical protein PCIT_a3247 [Pseudoalteromonas citrea]
MATSYFISNHLIDLTNATSILYIEWAIYDLLTIAFIVIIHKCFSLTYSCAVKYVFAGLTINILLFLSLYTDLVLLGKPEHWWFWDFFSVGINTIDIIIVCVLIVNRDFLWLVRLQHKIFRTSATQ